MKLLIISSFFLFSCFGSESEENNFNKAYILYSEGRLKEAKEIFKNDAKSNNNRCSMEYYAYCLIYDKPSDQDLAEAFRMLFQAAAQGNQEAEQFIKSLHGNIWGLYHSQKTESSLEIFKQSLKDILNNK